MIDHESTGITDPDLTAVKKNDVSPIQAVDTGEEQSLEEVWQQLTEIQQEICIQFSVSDWQAGFNRDFIDYFLSDIGASWSVIEELVERGVIEAQPAAVFSQRWLDENADHVKKHDSFLHDPLRGISNEERVVIQEISRHRSIVQNNQPELRYRLHDQDFHDWIDMQFGEEEEYA